MQLIERLQVAFPFSRREVDLLVNTAPRRYKIHTIEKRNGRGTRLIAQPTAELKLVQKWLVSEYLRYLPVHEAATAYRTGISIKDHAQRHASNRYLLKLDFKDFFPSIKSEDFKKHLAKFSKFDNDDQLVITRLLFRSDRQTKELILSIGAPSSPFVSNTIMFVFDEIVSSLCKDFKVDYTRYADDLAFSTNHTFILDKIKDRVVEICSALDYPKLSLNEQKTVFTSKKRQRQLTGLILSNDGHASLGRERKREIRAMAHRYSYNLLTPEETGKLRGILAFSLSIDKDFVDSIKRMLGDYEYTKLVRGVSESS